MNLKMDFNQTFSFETVPTGYNPSVPECSSTHKDFDLLRLSQGSTL